MHNNFFVFNIAFREACKYIQEHLTVSSDELGRDCLVNVAKTSMSSKLIGAYPFHNFYPLYIIDCPKMLKFVKIDFNSLSFILIYTSQAFFRMSDFYRSNFIFA